MRIGVYARVSTDDKEQDPETQLMPIRDWAEGVHEIVTEGIDYAPANDYGARKSWQDIKRQASRRRFEMLVVWRVDRMCRSVLDGANTLEELRAWGVGFRSYSEPYIDTTSPFGEAMFHITVTWAQLEREIHIDRVRAGMARAKRQGKRIGRPGMVNDPDLIDRVVSMSFAIQSRTITKADAARQLMISPRTLDRVLDALQRVNGLPVF